MSALTYIGSFTFKKITNFWNATVSATEVVSILSSYERCTKHDHQQLVLISWFEQFHSSDSRWWMLQYSPQCFFLVGYKDGWSFPGKGVTALRSPLVDNRGLVHFHKLQMYWAFCLFYYLPIFVLSVVKNPKPLDNLEILFWLVVVPH